MRLESSQEDWHKAAAGQPGFKSQHKYGKASCLLSQSSAEEGAGGGWGGRSKKEKNKTHAPFSDTTCAV